MRRNYLFLLFGAFFGGASVIFSAMGYHFFGDNLQSEQLETYRTAVQYLMYHAIVLIVLFRGNSFLNNLILCLSGWLFTAGICLFSGGLLIGLLTDLQVVSSLPPLGGIALILGWLLLAIHAIRHLLLGNTA